ncbi:hypothetical protein QBC46DRAFT_386150 [Diplogelasinospora grovesii]|uniref:Uncharacterized protein n=1 Tax=Diplogelasinospora grovesii TaxID=303347 RepID=A0AAN6S537_9PEZI|nr:hypothetical protein QBC46DRAFT_386150 [Diplogelasinospora grovesii]
MADLGTIMTVIDLVNRAIAIYQRMEDLPTQMRQLNRRMKNLNVYLVRLEGFVRKKSASAYDNPFSGQKKELADILTSIKENVEKVYDLFERYEQGILSRSHDLRFRLKWASELWFSLVDKSPEKIQVIMEEIDNDRSILGDYMGFMNIQGVEVLVNDSQQAKAKHAKDEKEKAEQAKLLAEIHAALVEKKNGGQKKDDKVSPTNEKKKEKDKAEGKKDTQSAPAREAEQTKPKAEGAKKKVETPQLQVVEVKKARQTLRLSPSPSPTPPRKDYKVLFVDPHNIGRSVVAEGLMKLMRGLTQKANGDWRIQTIHSAGFFVWKKGLCADIIDNLDYSYKSFKMPLVDGGQAPNLIAMSALFDNKSYDFPFKKGITEKIMNRTSRGLKRDIFLEYDFIIVFTNREHDNMIKLKNAIKKNAEGKKITALRKGRVLHLGTYLNPDGPPKEILAPLKGKEDREIWNRKVAEIKTAIKQFLKQEMKWKQPDQKAIESSNNLHPGHPSK